MQETSGQCFCYQAVVPAHHPALAHPSGLTRVPGVQHKGEIRGQLALNKHSHVCRLLGHPCNAHNRGENGETRSKDASRPCTSTAMEDRKRNGMLWVAWASKGWTAHPAKPINHACHSGA